MSVSEACGRTGVSKLDYLRMKLLMERDIIHLLPCEKFCKCFVSVTKSRLPYWPLYKLDLPDKATPGSRGRRQLSW